MAHVIGEPCIGVKDASCASVCPVACIHDGGDRYVIDRARCIDCGACVVVCPVSAISPEGLLPTEWQVHAAWEEGAARQMTPRREMSDGSN